MIIKLTKGYNAIVDMEDFGSLVKYNWYYDHGYAARRENFGKRAKVYMHRQIMGLTGKKICDHANGNGLDNRKDNLRMCTQHENQANRKVRKDSGWQIKGVHFHKRDKLFSARIIVNGKQIHLGYAKTPEKVHELYANAANRYFGAFARA